MSILQVVDSNGNPVHSVTAINRVWSFSPAVGDAKDESATIVFTVVTDETPWSVTSEDWVYTKILSANTFEVIFGKPNDIGYGGRTTTGQYYALVTVSNPSINYHFNCILNIGYGDFCDQGFTLGSATDLYTYTDEDGNILTSEDGLFDFIVE